MSDATIRHFATPRLRRHFICIGAATTFTDAAAAYCRRHAAIISLRYAMLRHYYVYSATLPLISPPAWLRCHL